MISIIIGFLINGLVIAAFLNLNKFNAQKIQLTILSLLSTIMVSAIPAIGMHFDKKIGVHYVGFPADMLVYHGGTLVSFASFGLVFNFFFFYWMFKLINKTRIFIFGSVKV